MRKLSVRFRAAPDRVMSVGTLAEQDRRIYFEYSPDFLDTGLELSPFKLPAREGLFEHTDRSFGPLPGLFDDSLPDGWGLLLMDRHFRQTGHDLATISPLDRLAWLGSRTMGSLTYHPPTQETDGPSERLIDLYELGCNAASVLAGEATQILPKLLRAGGSPGGARPKVLVGVEGERIISGEDTMPEGYEAWIVKFPAETDAAYAGPLEYAYSLMAAAAGIDMPRTRMFDVGSGAAARRYFAVRRFDRGRGGRRMHVHTFANLVHVDFRLPTTDYADLFRVTRALTKSHQDVLRLFRRMVFNVAACNRDDHAKNFAFLLDDESLDWSLSPAYDLTFSPGPGGEHTTTLMGEGRRPTRAHCLSLAGRAGIRADESSRILEQVNAAIERWREFADQARCPRRATAEAGKKMTLL